MRNFWIIVRLVAASILTIAAIWNIFHDEWGLAAIELLAVHLMLDHYD